MMLGLFLAAATLPKLLNMPLDNSDYPARAQRENRSGILRTQVVIGPDGRVRECSIVESSGSADFDRLTCASFKVRARYVPATDDKGTPMYGVVTTASAWTINGPPAKRPEFSDIELRIKPISQLKLPVIVGVILMADASGKITNCSAQRNAEPMLQGVACSQASQLSPLAIIHDDEGKPVATVRNAAIQFTTDSGIK